MEDRTRNPDPELMDLAIREARRSSPEDGRIHPNVGAVVLLNGEVIGSGHRGELGAGDHAEFTVLERKLGDRSITGSTVYTTLEPCTSRSHPKVPCATRLVERGVARVVIGILDPDVQIRGRGYETLRNAGIAVELFRPEAVSQIEELNRNYIRLKRNGDLLVVDDAFVATTRGRSLDDWYRVLNSLYWSKNSDRAPSEIFAHMVEVVGGVSALASSKNKPGIDPAKHLAKAFAWWMSLCGSVGVQSPERMLWAKFPAVCPYCLSAPHDPDVCLDVKRAQGGPRWDELADIGRDLSPPGRLGDWQTMFAKVYPVQQTDEYGLTFARLAEELGELAEAVRVFRNQPGYFLSEASDVFAWFMKIQNLYDVKAGISHRDRGKSLETTFATSYPDSCTECGARRCRCPDILPSTVGRIGHEDPTGIGDESRFMSPDVRRRKFSE
jgi:pyrimidine deaminase RibD-like protein/NTP pyrophosphatase (non-canonical NTP hydrolase)